ncbi:MAG: hypothetical protein KDD99_06655 [Bacteroidetes bacterium]|nr:hypothetical protein [Bacteroidota bacterium]
MGTITNTFDLSSRIALEKAQKLGTELGHETFGAPHLLKVLLQKHEVSSLLVFIEKGLKYLEQWADFRIKEYETGLATSEKSLPDDIIHKILQKSEEYSQILETEQVTVTCMMAAICTPNVGFSEDRIRSLGVTEKEIVYGVKPQLAHRLLTKIHGNMGTDIRVESYAELLINGNLFKEDEIHILPTGKAKRDFSNDIIDAKFEVPDIAYHYHRKEKPLLQIHTSRSSILDYLPEAFFLSPYDEVDDDKLSPEEKEKARQAYREKIQSAKNFFKPLELEFNRLRVARELHEVLMVKTYAGIFEDIYADSWFGLKNLIQKNPAWRRFIKTLHLTSYVVGDQEKTRELIQFVLNKGVEIQCEWVYEPVQTSSKKLELGNVPLGHEFYLGSIVYIQGLVARLTIKDLKPEEFYDFYEEDSATSKLIEQISKYYFPLDVEVKIDYQIQEGQTDFSLKPKEEKSGAILGYMTSI